jgi:antibiotic biosynthesis monooxygenase (ABM) superfamily enzyme
MAWIQRKWTPQEADEWKKEDWIAILFSTLAYIALTVGVALSLLLLTIGFIVLALGVIFTLFLFYVIDPKLKAISSSYEEKQKEYLESLERVQRWEE